MTKKEYRAIKFYPGLKIETKEGFLFDVVSADFTDCLFGCSKAGNFFWVKCENVERCF